MIYFSIEITIFQHKDDGYDNVALSTYSKFIKTIFTNISFEQIIFFYKVHITCTLQRYDIKIIE